MGGVIILVGRLFTFFNIRKRGWLSLCCRSSVYQRTFFLGFLNILSFKCPAVWNSILHHDLKNNLLAYEFIIRLQRIVLTDFLLNKFK